MLGLRLAVRRLPGQQAQLEPQPARSPRLPARREPLLVQLPLELRSVLPGRLEHPERLERPGWCCPA